jgi:hypothetical protein
MVGGDAADTSSSSSSNGSACFNLKCLGTGIPATYSRCTQFTLHTQEEARKAMTLVWALAAVVVTQARLGLLSMWMPSGFMPQALD